MLYKRPYSYQSPYHQQQPIYYDNPYYFGPVPAQYSPKAYYNPNPNMYANEPMPYQKTPFEHFAKPQQPVNWYQSHSIHTPPPNNMNTTNNLKAYFQDENGQMDIDKMFSTVGQLANTVQQVSPVIKQFGSLFKSFR